MPNPDEWYVLPINPEQWEVGPLSVARRKGGGTYPVMGRAQQLHAYQEAIREGLLAQRPADMPIRTEDMKLSFFFFRRQDDYEAASGRRVRKHVVDVTNMQKALEDAMQGIVFENDNKTRSIRSEIIVQGPNTVPAIVIHVQDFLPVDLSAEFPEPVTTQLATYFASIMLPQDNPYDNSND